jgi:hypothetical protein
MKVKEGPTYHAHPNYHNEGPWQDWGNVSFGQDEQPRCVPNGSIQNIVLLYIHHFVDDNGDQSNEIRALVQTCNYQVCSDHARQLHMEETHLCSHWQLSMKRGSSQDEVRVNISELYSVSAKDLKSPILVFEENPGLCESWQGKQYVWSVRDRQTEWSHMFPLLDD